jgi:hypothetical protein
MARVLPVLCALLFFFALAAAQVDLGPNVRTITFDSLDSKIDYTLFVVTDATLINPNIDVLIDGKRDNSVVKVGNAGGTDVEISLPNVVPVKAKTPTPRPARTSSKPNPTSKPSVSDASAFSPVMALVSLAAAGLCRGLTQNNRLSLGLFVVLVLAIALATETDASSTVEASTVDTTVGLPTGWTTQLGTPPSQKNIKKDFDLFLFPPTASASVAVSPAASSSSTPTISVTPTMSM